MSNFGEVHSRFSAVMKRINSTAAKLFFLKLAVGRTIGLFYGRLTHIRSPSQEMKWENEWLMFALLGISTFLFQKKKERKKGGKRKNSLGCHPSESWWREVDGKIVPGAARPYVDGLFVSVLKNAYAVQCTSLPPSFYRENEMALKLKEPLISPLAYIFDRSTYWRASLLFLKPQKTLLMTTLWKYRKSPI